MRLFKFWKWRVPDRAENELTGGLDKTENGTDLPDDGRIDEMQRRLAKVESDLASSWALQPREEYEKRVLGGMKHQINAYLARVAAGTVIFLAGAGYVLIETKTIATYHKISADQYQKVLDGLRAEFRELKEQSKATDEWQAVHNLGVLYRFAIRARLYDIQKSGGAARENQQKLIADLIETARGHFEKALQKDGTNPSTHWELGNLYYSIPCEENLRYLVDKQRAVRHFERAAQSYEKEEIDQGYRADTYKRLAEIQGALYREQINATGTEQQLALLDKIRDCYRRAQADYEAMQKPPEWVPGELEKIRRALQETEEQYSQASTVPEADV